MRPTDAASVRLSPSTWQQPCPAPASDERSALTETLAERVLTAGPGRLLVGIDGFTAAGKTSFGHELAAHIAASGRPVLRAAPSPVLRAAPSPVVASAGARGWRIRMLRRTGPR